MSDQGFSLALAFDTDDPVEQTIHATNSEMAIRMCESLDREFSVVGEAA